MIIFTDRNSTRFMETFSFYGDLLFLEMANNFFFCTIVNRS